MAHLIDKSALVAEIERRKEEEVNYDENGGFASWADRNHYSTLNSIQDFLNTLEVKEVDLESEIDRVWDNTSEYFFEDSWKEFEYIAKHFFELGLKVQKGEYED